MDAHWQETSYWASKVSATGLFASSVVRSELGWTGCTRTFKDVKPTTFLKKVIWGENWFLHAEVNSLQADCDYEPKRAHKRTRWNTRHSHDCCSLARLEVFWDWHQIVTPSSNSFIVRRFCQRGDRTWRKKTKQKKTRNPMNELFCQCAIAFITVKSSLILFFVFLIITFTILEPCSIRFTLSSSCTPGRKIWSKTVDGKLPKTQSHVFAQKDS